MDNPILSKIRRRFIVDKEQRKELYAYDDMVEMRWKLPDGLVEKAWAVKYIDPICHDAEKVATNFFDTYNPKWDVLPLGPEDQDAAEEKETFLEWHMTRANRHGDTEPIRDILKHSLRYDRVACQLDYLPYWLPKDRSQWTDAQKEAMWSGPFCVYVHDPKEVFYEMGKYGLRWVAKVANVPASDVVDHWEIYNQADISQVQKWLEKDPKARVVLVDYTDLDQRYVGCWQVQTADLSENQFDQRGFVPIFEGKNDLGFINWAIASGSSGSMFQALHRGDLWVNANRTESIKRSDIYRRAFYPLGMEEGVGDDIEFDYSGDQVIVKVPPGKKLTPLARPPVDPGWAELSAEDRSVMSESTSIQTLSGIRPHSNVQFATVNAFIQLSLSNLEPYKRTAEKVLAIMGGMCFKWLEVTSKGDNSYAEYATRSRPRKDSAGNLHKKGEKLAVTAGSFDPEHLYIDVTLIANTPSDKLQLSNIALQLIQSGMPIPMEEHMERLGYSNPDVLKAAWEREQIEKAAVQNYLQQQSFNAQQQLRQQIQAEVMKQMQQQQQQAQKQAQEQAQQQQNGNPMVPGGPGFNPAMGGSSPAEAAPQVTQTQIRSQGDQAIRSAATDPMGIMP